jgi:hypothetical protein
MSSLYTLGDFAKPHGYFVFCDRRPVQHLRCLQQLLGFFVISIKPLLRSFRFRPVYSLGPEQAVPWQSMCTVAAIVDIPTALSADTRMIEQ